MFKKLLSVMVVALTVTTCSSEMATQHGTQNVAADSSNGIDVLLADQETPELNVADFQEDLGPPVAGQFGAFCTVNGDCNSGHCIENTDHQNICTTTCTENCTAGFVCKQIAGSGEMVSICAPKCVKYPELCDGVDNDCDGITDNSEICDDGNLCTTDACAEKNCKHDKLTGNPCSDGNACTQTDECHDGQCLGGNPHTCTDDDPCTQDNVCKPIDGCVFPPQDGPCNDGNACTEKDLCANGSCGPGTKTSCSDKNPCTYDNCNPKWGCDFSPVDDGPAPVGKNGCPPTAPYCANGKCVNM